MRLLGVAALILLSARTAGAEVSATERALARELFVQGRKLLAEKKFAEACPKLAESQRIDPAPGTLLNLAVCHEEEGKTATAWSEFNDALTLARRDGRGDRVRLAETHLKKLEPRLSRLALEVPAAARVPGLVVALDGTSLGEALWGSEVPIDPGHHVIEASAPGRKAWRAEVTLGADADRKSLQVPELLLLPKPVKPRPKPRPKPADTGKTQRLIGYGVGGVGVVALGIGGYFGLRAFSRWDDRNAHCSDAGCDPKGVEAGDDADTAATIADVGIGIGVVGVGVGTYLVLSAGSSERTLSAQPTADGGGAVVRYGGAF